MLPYALPGFVFAQPDVGIDLNCWPLVNPTRSQPEQLTLSEDEGKSKGDNRSKGEANASALTHGANNSAFPPALLHVLQSLRTEHSEFSSSMFYILPYPLDFANPQSTQP